MLALLSLPPDGSIVLDGDPFASGRADSGFGGFGALVVLFMLVGVGIAVYKIWWAGELARRRGHDPSEARLTSFLTGDEGTAAAYMRAERQPTSKPSPTVEERLRQLEQLRSQGLVTDDEFAAKRTEILDDL